MKLKKIPEGSLEKISGGHSVSASQQDETYLCVSRPEHKLLENSRYIIDGKFNLDHLDNARICLENNGYHLSEDEIYTLFQQHDSDNVKIKIQPYT